MEIANTLSGHNDSMAAAGGGLLYVGTYTNGASEGIYAFRHSADCSELTPLGLAARMENPSFLAVHPNGRFLYAIGEVKQWNGHASGFVSAYSVDAATGVLTRINTVSSVGAGPCHVALDRSGQFVFVSNYVGGSLTVFRLRGDGGLGQLTGYQQHSDSSTGDPQKPRVHGAFPSHDNRFVIVPDKGLSKLFVYRFSEGCGDLEIAGEGELPPGSGPRHFVFHPSKGYGYVVNELSSTITTFEYDRVSGALKPRGEVPTLASSFVGDNVAAEIAIDREGKFLYASNRGADTIAAYSIGQDGSLGIIEHLSTQGKCPRHFAFDPAESHLVVANQESHCIVVSRRDFGAGCLVPCHQLAIESPACCAFISGA
jgi:6-phosphogluconolactonase